MIYVKAEDLKPGMRLARPIYNKKGILLYGRNDKITRQGIKSVKNFGLIGLYILEPAEPLPPMSEEEMEFERFQTMAVFSIREDLDAIIKGETPDNLMKQTDELVRRFGNLYHKITFNQNLRSPEDYVYKHALNVAILAALISHRAGFGVIEQTEVVVAALLHDLGKLSLPPQLKGKSDNLTEEEEENVARAVILGIDKISDAIKMPSGVKSILMQLCQVQYVPDKAPDRISDAVKVLMVANAYDEYTAMRLGEDPHTEVEAVRMLQADPEQYDSLMVKHLLDSIKILYPGVCVELTNFEKGLVLNENDNDILRPVVLSFNRNEIYNLDIDSVHRSIQIKDIMKTMDNRIKVDPERLKEYM
ncbi:MAG: HD domain-containing protein [Bacteroidales bacterium]|nr:HD domain-containing protein [Clostridium sp.]MCM1203707.1 HD domain-containing protein [Bacteroidales bacterium]